MDTTTNPPLGTISSEERLWAALSHATVLLFGWGLIGPVVVWVLQRRKSTYATFQALQALAYQMFFMLYWVVAVLCLSLLLFIFIFGFTLGLEGSASSEDPAFLFVSQFIYMIGMFAAAGVYGLLGLVGAGMCLAGKDFRYPLLGRWMERYLSRGVAVQPAPAPAQEETP